MFYYNYKLLIEKKVKFKKSDVTTTMKNILNTILIHRITILIGYIIILLPIICI